MNQENPVTGSKRSIIKFYRIQLEKFNKIGIGKRTNDGVVVTQKLIDITKKRLSQLSVSYRNILLSKKAKYNKSKYIKGEQ